MYKSKLNKMPIGSQNELNCRIIMGGNASGNNYRDFIYNYSIIKETIVGLHSIKKKIV